MENPNTNTGGPESDRRDPVRELQARLDAAIEEVRPKIRKALDELDTRMQQAVADVKPRAQSAMQEVRPKVDQFVADVQPRLDTLLQRLQSRIEELRRDLDERASRAAAQAEPVAEIPAHAGPSAPGVNPDASPGTQQQP